MKIGFWLTTPKQFDPSKLDETPFGGAEISAINLAKQLAYELHEVTVFANVLSCGDYFYEPCNFNPENENEESLYFTTYDSLKKSNNLDVLICVRADQNLLNPRRNAQYFGRNKPKIILWTGDAYDQPNNQIFHDQYCLNEIDLIVTKSNWQRDTLLQHFPLLSLSKMQVMYNGVDSDNIPEPKEVTEPRFVYASTAYRGLHRFIDIWPKIKERIPKATLDCYCKTTLYIDDNPGDKQYQWIYDALEKLDGVTIKEPLPQKEFLKELSGYYAMLYPNTGFLESSCGVALQSMACGVPVVTSARGGLPETINMGLSYCIDQDKDYDEKFVKVVNIFWDHKKWKNQHSDICRRRICNNYSWKEVAKKWQSLILKPESLLNPMEQGSQEFVSEFSPAEA